MFWNKYPYTNFHELNLDFILKAMKELDEEWDEFKALNTITAGGEWDITKSYPQWCIVNANNGRDGYISIQPVPAGIDITNEDYWLAVANYSDIVADLQNRVITLENEMVSVKSDIEYTPAFSLNTLKTKNAILIGDSWGVTQSGAGGINNWVDLITPYFNQVYADARGGYSFNRLGYSFITILNSIVVPSDVQIDIIMAIGGANPTNDGEVTDFVNACKSAYPDAEIILGCNGPCESMSNNWHVQEQVHAEGAAKGCIIIDKLWQTTLREDITNWTNDHYHLKDLSRFTKNIISYLINGSFVYTYNAWGAFVPTWSNVGFDAYYKDTSWTAYTRQNDHIMFSMICSKSTNYNAAPASYTFTSADVSNGIDLGPIEITGAIPFYFNTQANLRHHMYTFYQNAYYRVGLYNPSSDPFCHLFVLPKQAGTFTKVQLFPENDLINISACCDMFDYKGFTVAQDAENSMVAFTRTQKITV